MKIALAAKQANFVSLASAQAKSGPLTLNADSGIHLIAGAENSDLFILKHVPLLLRLPVADKRCENVANPGDVFQINFDLS